jgi:alcohol dehydrogenase
VKGLTEGRGVDVAVDAVGHPDALDTAIRLARKGGTVSVVGVYAERQQVHMGLVWIKNLTLVTGHANVIAHLDPVLALMQSERVDIGPLVSREMPLAEAADAYAAYAARSSLKIVLRP